MNNKNNTNKYIPIEIGEKYWVMSGTFSSEPKKVKILDVFTKVDGSEYIKFRTSIPPTVIGRKFL